MAGNDCNLSNVYHSLEDYRKAIKYSEKSLEVSTAMGDQSVIASDNCNLGNTHLTLGEYQQAINYYKKCL